MTITLNQANQLKGTATVAKGAMFHFGKQYGSTYIIQTINRDGIVASSYEQAHQMYAFTHDQVKESINNDYSKMVRVNLGREA